MLRRPSVAGQFYPASKSALEKELGTFTDKKSEKVSCLGVVVPHAGYMYSGPVAGKVFSRMKPAESYIIMGPNHTGFGQPFSIMTQGSWQMPQGKVDIDAELSKNLLSASEYLKEDELAHSKEHSIEVQLPFLQYIKNDFQFVPIVISHSRLDIYQKLGKELARSIKNYKKPVTIVASSDMTHYEDCESAKIKDRLAIDAILKLDETKLMNMISKHNISMCGYAPTIVMLAAVKELGAKSAVLVDYKTSGDSSGDYSSVVGYAGIIIA